MNRPHPPAHFTMPSDPKPYISIMTASSHYKAHLLVGLIMVIPASG
ncbi:TPA: hypothetical protein ACGR7J_001548 [Escherichia coli]|nr:hypothetical protein [Escherichia coli]